MILTIDEYGIDLQVRNRAFLVRNGTTQRQISPHRVTAIHCRKPCDISTPAIVLAAEHEIPLLVFSTAGKVKARLWRPTFGSLAEIRRQQIRFADRPEGRTWACDALVRKGTAQISLLKWLQNRRSAHTAALLAACEAIAAANHNLAASPNTTVAIRSQEAQAGRHYWQAYMTVFEALCPARKRSRQPAADPLNALLNYGYGILYSETETAVLSAGLDPHIGIVHREEYNHPAFVFDAIEPFRPWCDRLIAEMALAGEIPAKWFDIAPDKVWLTRTGKRTFIPAFYRMLNAKTLFRGRRIKRRAQLQQYMTDLAQDLLRRAAPPPSSTPNPLP